MKELFVPFKAKVGRPRRFAYPAQMLTAFEEYLKDRQERCVVIEESEEYEFGSVSRSDENKTSSKTKRKTIVQPLSIRDFCIYLGCSTQWWGNLPPEFLEVKRIIAEYLFNFKLKGAELGIFSANIVARDLGLADKREDSVKIEEIPQGFTKEQAKDFIANMNK